MTKQRRKFWQNIKVVRKAALGNKHLLRPFRPNEAGMLRMECSRCGLASGILQQPFPGEQHVTGIIHLKQCKIATKSVRILRR
jgi:hypothetical protein